MESFEWNKIIGAILGTLLFLFVVREAAHIIYPGGEAPEKMAYKIEIPEGEEGAPTAPAEAVDFAALLQTANARQGEAVAKRCLQCHTFEKGGPNRTGPNLWGILGSDIAAHPGFKYSNALSKLEGEWTYDRLYQFIGAPSRTVPGTNMNFAGLRRQSERIDLLAWLRTQSDSPPPLPEPLPAAEEGGPAEGTEGGAAEAPAGEEGAEGETAPAAETAPQPEGESGNGQQ